MQFKVVSSFIWKLLERGITQGVQLFVQIILARLLLPEMYGTIALVIVLIAIANVFIQSGLGTALIQKREADALDFSTVFYTNITLALVIYTLLFFLAPTIAHYYKNEELSIIIRVLSLVVFFGSVTGVQNAYISRNMLFKKLFKLSLVSTVLSGIVGVILAYLGSGIWSLVFQQLISQATLAIIMWLDIEWRPTRNFSFERLKDLYSFGYKLLLSSLIDTVYREIRVLIIGKRYTHSMLGFYNKGEQFPKMLMSSINGSIQAVMLPILSAHQNDKLTVKVMMRRSIMVSTFIVFPIMVGLATIAKPLVELLLTEKWLPSVPFLQVFCFSFMLWPFHTANLQAINALGRSDIFLKLELIKKCIGLVILVVSVPMGVMAIAVSSVIASITSSIINAWPNKKLLDYSYMEQVLDVLPSLGVSLLMGLSVWLISLTSFHVVLLLFIQILVGILSYILFSVLFKLEPLYYIKGVLRGLIEARRGQ